MSMKYKDRAFLLRQKIIKELEDTIKTTERLGGNAEITRSKLRLIQNDLMLKLRGRRIRKLLALEKFSLDKS